MNIESVSFHGQPALLIEGKVRVMRGAFADRNPEAVLMALIESYRRTGKPYNASRSVGLAPTTGARVLLELGLHQKSPTRAKRQTRQAAPPLERPSRACHIVTCACGCGRAQSGKRGLVDERGWWSPLCLDQRGARR